MADISPAAQAVLDAVAPHPVHPPAIAAAIRTAAEQAIPLPGHNPTTEWLAGYQAARRATHQQLQAIASELGAEQC